MNGCIMMSIMIMIMIMVEYRRRLVIKAGRGEEAHLYLVSLWIFILSTREWEFGPERNRGSLWERSLAIRPYTL